MDLPNLLSFPTSNLKYNTPEMKVSCCSRAIVIDRVSKSGDALWEAHVKFRDDKEIVCMAVWANYYLIHCPKAVVFQY